MDILKVVSAHTSQGSGPVQTPTKKDEESVSSISTATTATEAMKARLTDPKDLDKKQQISSAAKEINSFFQMAQRSLEFTVDEDSGHMVMQIKDTQTDELIRQIPGEDVLKLAKRLDDLTGVLFKAQA